MGPHQRHWLDKTQVQVASLLALAAVYFLAWPLFKPWDEGGAVAFVPVGDVARLLLLAGVVAVVALGCTLLTLHARPEGALLACLVGLAGLSFRSGQMCTLLWLSEGRFRAAYVGMAGEILLLGLMLLESMAIIWIVRSLVRLIRPTWVWAEQPATAEAAGALTQSLSADWKEFTGSFAKDKNSGLTLLAAMAMELAIAVILLVCTFRSSDRGQVAFALAGSFLLGALASHQVFPVRFSLPFWLGPILMALGVYVLAPDPTVLGAGPAWFNELMVASSMPLRAALPMDWLSLGGGGAVAGYWISRRIHQARIHEQINLAP